MVWDFDRQVAEFQVRVAVPNGYTALGIPVTMVAGQVCPGTGAVRTSAELCKRAPPGQNLAGEPVHDSHQIEEAAAHGQVTACWTASSDSDVITRVIGMKTSCTPLRSK